MGDQDLGRADGVARVVRAVEAALASALGANDASTATVRLARVRELIDAATDPSREEIAIAVVEVALDQARRIEPRGRSFDALVVHLLVVPRAADAARELALLDAAWHALQAHGRADGVEIVLDPNDTLTRWSLPFALRPVLAARARVVAP